MASLLENMEAKKKASELNNINNEEDEKNMDEKRFLINSKKY